MPCSPIKPHNPIQRADSSHPFKINTFQVHNRILALMAYTSRYAFKSESRLAQDAGLSKSAVCRLLNGQSSFSFALVSALARALEPHLQRGLRGKKLDPDELIPLDGTYPTASACELAGCKGCLPQEAYDEQNRIKLEYRHLQPAQWSLSPVPSTQPFSRKPSSNTSPSAAPHAQRQTPDGEQGHSEFEGVKEAR